MYYIDTVGETLKHVSAKVLQPASLSLPVVQQGVNKTILHTVLCGLVPDHFPLQKLFYSEYSPKMLEAARSLQLNPFPVVSSSPKL